ncbi:MAG: DUF190 domain-containing protein [Deltaproteobacteria bacterium]|nr:DUF190 domain-containing protein [Deltaproteobacteria bacterium]
MKIPVTGKLLRIFIGESDRYDGKPLYEAILLRARGEGLAGCTVIRGLAGFGASSRVHTTKILRLSEDLPMVIEIVDAEAKIDQFVKEIDGMIQEGLVTVEQVQVIVYRHHEANVSADITDRF